jgi:hypothetical protein
VADAGAVSVLYGSASGLSDRAEVDNQLWDQDTGSIVDVAETGDRFGAALAAGNINGDGRADLAVGVPDEDIGADDYAGAVNVLYGASPVGLHRMGNQFWHQDSPGVVDAASSSDEFGAALAVGDFDGNRLGDLAVGVPGERVATAAGAGAVSVLYGSVTGSELTAAADQIWTQDSLGVWDDAETDDWFGSALAAGDFKSRHARRPGGRRPRRGRVRGRAAADPRASRGVRRGQRAQRGRRRAHRDQ